MSAPAGKPKPKRRWLKILGITAASIVGLIVVLIAGLLVFKPWTPKPEVAQPAAGGVWVRDKGLVGHWYPADTANGPAVVVIGGSEGGLSSALVEQATALRAEGFSVLALAFFGVEGRPGPLVDVDLEYFSTGIDWLSTQPQVDAKRIGMMGGSKGAEAALLVAGREPRLRSVVAAVPSHVVWQGLNLAEFWTMATSPSSSWTVGGRPLPYAPTKVRPGQPFVDGYNEQLDAGVPPESLIDTRSIKASVLLTCGGRDLIWPSCRMGQALVDTAPQRIRLLSYPDAGHLVQGPPRQIPVESDEAAGGTAAANDAARRDAWPKIVQHLRATLG